MFCPRSPCFSAWSDISGRKKSRTSDPNRGHSRKSTTDSNSNNRTISSAYRWTIKTNHSQTDPRNFVRTIGVSRRECGAWRCTVRTPSLQLWAIPRRGEPHNELTILPSISKLAVYSCRERSLPGFFHLPLNDQRGTKKARERDRRPKNNVLMKEGNFSRNSFRGNYVPLDRQ